MLPFLAMIFTLRLGLGVAPTEGAVRSLREHAHAVAAQQAQREASRELAAQAAAEASRAWEPPARTRPTREDWLRMLEETLSNETIANAAVWLATQPVSVSVSDRRFFVTLRFATP